MIRTKNTTTLHHTIHPAGLVVSAVEVPRYLLLGETASLACHYHLQEDQLYSLTWWKDGRQFYSYIPSNNPRVVVFDVPGVNVNVSID